MKSKLRRFHRTSSHCVFSNTIQNLPCSGPRNSQPMGYQDRYEYRYFASGRVGVSYVQHVPLFEVIVSGIGVCADKTTLSHSLPTDPARLPAANHPHLPITPP